VSGQKSLRKSIKKSVKNVLLNAYHAIFDEDSEPEPNTLPPPPPQPPQAPLRSVPSTVNLSLGEDAVKAIVEQIFRFARRHSPERGRSPSHQDTKRQRLEESEERDEHPEDGDVPWGQAEDSEDGDQDGEWMEDGHGTTRKALIFAPTFDPEESPTPPPELTPLEERIRRAAELLDVLSGWDGWPDGPAEWFLSKTRWLAMDRLQGHWAYQGRSTRIGSKDAQNPADGRLYIRRCQGVFVCSQEGCTSFVRRPQTTKQGRAGQNASLVCEARDGLDNMCGAPMQRVECGAELHIREYGGDGRIYIQHFDYHEHPRHNEKLHLLPEERESVKTIILPNLKLGPRALATGAPGRDPLYKISTILLNPDRVGYEKRKLKKGELAGYTGALERDMAELEAEYPNAIVFEDLEGLGVVCVQTDFMRKSSASALTGERASRDDPVYGSVTDAAHKYWKEKNSILILSTRYVDHLRSWIPVLATYARGQSEAYFHIHFLMLMKGVYEYAMEMKLGEAQDEWFAIVSLSCTTVAVRRKLTFITLVCTDCRFQPGREERLCVRFCQISTNSPRIN
jgi:hypothetical protein